MVILLEICEQCRGLYTLCLRKSAEVRSVSMACPRSMSYNFDKPSTLNYDSSMNSSSPRHPIRVVARRTGLLPATLRAWERRYQIVVPFRSDTGRRLYSDDDVERLTLLRELTEVGRSIGSVAELTNEEARRLLAEDSPRRGGGRVGQDSVEGIGGGMGPAGSGVRWVEEAYQAMLRLDGPVLEGTLRRSSRSLGATAFLQVVAAPLLERIGEGWESGEVSPAQEHFASDLIEQVLHSLTGTSSEQSNLPCVVVATLPGERHGLGGRLAAAAAVGEGWRAVYLGVDLPVVDMARAASSITADVVAISVVSLGRGAEVAAGLTELRALLPRGIEIIVGGRGVVELESTPLPTGVRVVSGLDGLRDELARIERRK